LFQRIGGVDTAIIEFDALADAVGPAPEDNDLIAIARRRFAFGRRQAVTFVAGIDALEDWPDVQFGTTLRHGSFARPANMGDASVGKSELLQPMQFSASCG